MKQELGGWRICDPPTPAVRSFLSFLNAKSSQNSQNSLIGSRTQNSAAASPPLNTAAAVADAEAEAEEGKESWDLVSLDSSPEISSNASSSLFPLLGRNPLTAAAAAASAVSASV